jgi:FkbM family methyltransferase
VELADLWPQGEIHAFEPVDGLFAQLHARTRRCKNVKCYCQAVGDRTGVAELFISSGASDGSSSLLSPTGHVREHPDVKFARVTAVPVTTLDDWSKAQSVQRADLLWLDLQGAELRTIQAAPRILSTVRLVYMEVSLVELYAGSPLYPEARQWMAAHGFKPEWEAFPWRDAGNVLFRRTRLTPDE